MALNILACTEKQQLRKSMPNERGVEGSALKLHDGSNPGFCVSRIKETRNIMVIEAWDQVRWANQIRGTDRLLPYEPLDFKIHQVLILPSRCLGKWPVNPKLIVMVRAKDIQWTKRTKKFTRQSFRLLPSSWNALRLSCQVFWTRIWSNTPFLLHTDSSEKGFKSDHGKALHGKYDWSWELVW